MRTPLTSGSSSGGGGGGGLALQTLLDLDATTVPAGVYTNGSTFTTTDAAARTITWSVEGTTPTDSITPTPGTGIVLSAGNGAAVQMIARFNALPGVLAMGPLWRVWSRWDLTPPPFGNALALSQLNGPPGGPAVAGIVRQWGAPNTTWGPRVFGAGQSSDPFWLSSDVMVLEQSAGVFTMRMGSWGTTWPALNAARVRDSQYPDPTSPGVGWYGNGGAGIDMTTGGLELGLYAGSGAQTRTLLAIKLEAVL